MSREGEEEPLVRAWEECKRDSPPVVWGLVKFNAPPLISQTDPPIEQELWQVGKGQEMP